MDAVEETVAAPLRAFFKDSYRLVKRCNKPDRKGAFSSQTGRRRRRLLLVGLLSFLRPLRSQPKRPPSLPRAPKPTTTEFTQITVKTAVGFLIMGFIGFFVKLLFIVSWRRRRRRRSTSARPPSRCVPPD